MMGFFKDMIIGFIIYMLVLVGLASMAKFYIGDNMVGSSVSADVIGG